MAGRERVMEGVAVAGKVVVALVEEGARAMAMAVAEAATWQ